MLVKYVLVILKLQTILGITFSLACYANQICFFAAIQHMRLTEGKHFQALEKVTSLHWVYTGFSMKSIRSQRKYS